MKCFKVIFSLLLLLSLVLPGTVSAQPANVEPPPDNAIYIAEIPLSGTMEALEPAAAQKTEVSVNIKASKAVTISEESPNLNYNSGAERAYVRVGTTPEFGYPMWTLLTFSPVKKAQGGPLPNDAEITRARIKMYKASGAAGTVKVHRINDDFNEGTVNWSNKPSTSAALASVSIPSANGLCYLDVPAAAVTAFTNHGQSVRLSLKPDWTNASKSISFQSDEHPSQGPVLVIYYMGSAPAGAAPAPGTPTPTPPPSDTASCVLTYTVSPTHPAPGQSVTITATATDDHAMYYLTIMRGSIELARRDATSGQRELTASYTETAQLPSMNYQLFADDLGPASPVSRTVTVPVTGSGTAPTVSVSAEWLTVDRVVPEKYRLIKNDGQQVQITAEASDPDGIRELHIFVNGIDHPFTYSGTGETSVSETVGWENNEPSRTRFYYYAQARDRELQTTTAEGGDYHINQPQDIRMMWDAATKIQNFGLNDRGLIITWDRMCQIFGDGECWNVESWGWENPTVLSYWRHYVDLSAGVGQCFGFATLAAELYHGRISPSQLEMPHIASELTYDQGYTGYWIQARQAGQMGEEVQIPSYDRGDMGGSSTLAMVESALESDNPGVVCIREGDKGHAVTPWMIRYMTDDTKRIYFYDSNRVSGIHNVNADFNNAFHYPYLVIDGSSWSYEWDPGTDPPEIWNDEINYITYEEACGDMDQLVDHPTLGESAPFLTDHDVPGIFDWVAAFLTSEIDAYFEDEEGNVTGMYNGQLREEIPGSRAVIPMMAGSFADLEMYILPKDKKVTIHAVGTKDGEYSLNLMGDGTLYSINKKKTLMGIEDLFIFEPWEGTLNYRFRVMPGVADDNFEIIIAAVFAGSVHSLGEESIDREYDMEDVSCGEGCDFSVSVEEDGSTLVVDNYGDDITFDAVTRSTESANVVDPNTDPGYIPSSVQEDISVEEGRRVEITPETWSSDEERGNLRTIGGAARGEGGAFPWIPVIIGVAVVAVVGAVLGVLFGKGILGKKVKPAAKTTKTKESKAKK